MLKYKLKTGGCQTDMREQLHVYSNNVMLHSFSNIISTNVLQLKSPQDQLSTKAYNNHNNNKDSIFPYRPSSSYQHLRFMVPSISSADEPSAGVSYCKKLFACGLMSRRDSCSVSDAADTVTRQRFIRVCFCPMNPEHHTRAPLRLFADSAPLCKTN